MVGLRVSRPYPPTFCILRIPTRAVLASGAENCDRAQTSWKAACGLRVAILAIVFTGAPLAAFARATDGLPQSQFEGTIAAVANARPDKGRSLCSQASSVEPRG